MNGWTFVVMGIIGGAALTSLVLAWRMAQDDRRRSEARVAALAAAIDPPGPGALSFVHEPPRQRNPLLTAATGLVAVVTALVLIAGTLAAVQDVASAQGGAGRRATPSVAAAQPAPQAREAALELLSVTYTRSAGRLLVTGLVRNQLASPLSGDAEVVVLDDRDRVLGSARAPLADAALPPGATSSFRLTLRDLAGLRRYRVSFTGPAGLIHHVDRRTRPDSR